MRLQPVEDVVHDGLDGAARLPTGGGGDVGVVGDVVGNVGRAGFWVGLDGKPVARAPGTQIGKFGQGNAGAGPAAHVAGPPGVAPDVPDLDADQVVEIGHVQDI